MQVHIAYSVSSGDNFVHPLGEIREVLERYVWYDCALSPVRVEAQCFLILQREMY